MRPAGEQDFQRAPRIPSFIVESDQFNRQIIPLRYQVEFFFERRKPLPRQYASALVELVHFIQNPGVARVRCESLAVTLRRFFRIMAHVTISNSEISPRNRKVSI